MSLSDSVQCLIGIYHALFLMRQEILLDSEVQVCSCSNYMFCPTVAQGTPINHDTTVAFQCLQKKSSTENCYVHRCYTVIVYLRCVSRENPVLCSMCVSVGKIQYGAVWQHRNKISIKWQVVQVLLHFLSSPFMPTPNSSVLLCSINQTRKFTLVLRQ